MSDIREIFEKITERYEIPIRLSNRCEASVYYRVEELTLQDLAICGQYVAQRVRKVCSPNHPEILIKLPGGFTELTDVLSKELGPPNEPLRVMTMEEVERTNGKGSTVKGAQVVLVNDVITTARSCLEAHTKVTILGASILCWAALIDRTFGPGPVPVITAFTGAPVTLLE